MKRSEVAITAALLFQALIETGTCEARGLKTAARELAAAAARTHVERVAVLPFVPADDSSARDGWNISEKLVTQLVRAGKVKTVERSLLRSLTEEHSLGRTGLLDARTLKQLGRLAAADGVVTGTFEILGHRAIVNARLIEVETGVILAASEFEVDRDWSDPAPELGESADGPIWVPAPRFIVQAPPLPDDDRADLRDAPSDSSCDGAAERVDRLEAAIIDLKARYWALKLRDGLRLADLKTNPGSTITNPALKRAFYERLKFWYDAEDVPPLSADEVRHFVSIDGQAYGLFRECGV